MNNQTISDIILNITKLTFDETEVVSRIEDMGPGHVFANSADEVVGKVGNLSYQSKFVGMGDRIGFLFDKQGNEVAALDTRFDGWTCYNSEVLLDNVQQENIDEAEEFLKAEAAKEAAHRKEKAKWQWVVNHCQKHYRKGMNPLKALRKRLKTEIVYNPKFSPQAGTRLHFEGHTVKIFDGKDQSFHF